MASDVQTKRSERGGKIIRACALLRKEILSGHYLPGSVLVLAHVGKKYGMAESTASVALGRLAHEGLVVRRRGQGTFVATDLPVRSKALDIVRTKNDPGHVYRDTSAVLAWVDAFTQAAEDGGWIPRWQHVSFDGNERIGSFASKFLASDGIITLFTLDPDLLRLLCSKGIPVVGVFLNSGGTGDREECFAQISWDRREACRIATEYLTSLGYSRLGFVALDNSPWRTHGFLEVISRRKLNVCGQWVLNVAEDVIRPGDESSLRCRQWCKELLVSKNRPEAICCSTARMAYVLKAVAVEMGMKVPDDLGIIACDEGEPNVSEQMGITTVAVSMEECAQKAVQILDQMVGQDERGEVKRRDLTLMPLHLKVRGSCRAKVNGLTKGTAELLGAEANALSNA